MALLDYLATEARPAAAGMLLNYRAPRGIDFVFTVDTTTARYVAAREVVSDGSIPTQFAGLRGQSFTTTLELCLVAEADAPSGMGAVVKIVKGSDKFAVYLVETDNANASPFRLQTTTGTKSIRLKT